jgi:hypothetical protein
VDALELRTYALDLGNTPGALAAWKPAPAAGEQAKEKRPRNKHESALTFI